MKNLRQTVLTAVLLVALAAVAALAVNFARPDGIPIFPAKSDADLEKALAADSNPLTATEIPPEFTDLALAKRLFDEGAVFADAREPEQFFAGHIRAARHLYYEEAEERVMEVFGDLAPKPQTLLVTYCDGADCNSSQMLARVLREVAGFENVHAFIGGWDAWRAAGYPIEKNPEKVRIFKAPRS